MAGGWVGTIKFMFFPGDFNGGISPHGLQRKDHLHHSLNLWIPPKSQSWGGQWIEFWVCGTLKLHSQQGHRGNTLNKSSEAWSSVLEGVCFSPRTDWSLTWADQLETPLSQALQCGWHGDSLGSGWAAFLPFNALEKEGHFWRAVHAVRLSFPLWGEMNCPLILSLIISQKFSRGGKRHLNVGNQLEILCFSTYLPPHPSKAHVLEGTFLAELIILVLNSYLEPFATQKWMFLCPICLERMDL